MIYWKKLRGDFYTSPALISKMNQVLFKMEYTSQLGLLLDAITHTSPNLNIDLIR